MPPASSAPAAPPPAAAPAPETADLPRERLRSVQGFIGGGVVGAGGRAGVTAKDKAGEEKTSSISIKPWDPKVPYLKALKEDGAEEAYAIYLKQRSEYRESPAFYLDCADFFFRKKQTATAIRVLSNTLELRLENPQLLRVVAHKLTQEGQFDLAVDLFEKVLRMRPEEPQSYRDLALALADRADRALPEKGRATTNPYEDYSRAMKLLNDVVTKEWDNRFREIEIIALIEINRMIGKVQALPKKEMPSIPLDSRLQKLLDVDVRIVLTWDTDLTDMDLWVTEPSGEKCMYSHNRTEIGGRMSCDFTQGYGPEEYLVHKAMSGKYKIQANYYGSREQTLCGPTTLQATVFTNYGRPNEERQTITLRLSETKEVIDIGTIETGK